MKLSVFFLAISIFIPYSEGFLGSFKESAHPMLAEFAQAQTGILLNVGLEIPKDLKDKSSSRLYIQDLSLELQAKHLLGNDVKLPGAGGPHPTCSTGPLGIKIHQQGKFVSMKGAQTVNFEKPCWEMLWLKDCPAGSIVCGFDLGDDVSRNDAVLHKGMVYVTFAVFTTETLEEARAKKAKYEETFNKYKDTQDAELEMMNSNTNPIMKAVHFRKAVAANEKASLMRTNLHDRIPTTDDEILSIGENLLLHRVGSVFTKTDAQMGTKHHTAVGTASLKD